MAYALELALRHPAGLGLPDLRAGGDSAGHARRHRHQPLAGLDAAAVAGDAGAALCLRLQRAPEPDRRPARTMPAKTGRAAPSMPLLFGARADGGHRADHADGRAGRLPALHAREDARQPLALVGRRAGRRAGLGDAGRAEDAGRRAAGLPGAVSYAVPADRAVDPNQMYLAAYEYVFSELRLGGGGHGAVRGGVAAQDQRHQRLRRLAGLEQLLLAPHAQPPRARGVGGVQHADRASC